MNNQPVRYAILRDGRNWDNITTAGLQPEEDGVLTLSKIPGPEDSQPVLLPPPFEAGLSGLAVGHCSCIYLSDTVGDRVIRIDLACDNAQTVLAGSSCRADAPGVFKSPRGMAAVPGRLYVADSNNKRIQVFHLPGLELIDIWEGIFDNPTCLAVDSQVRIYVLDRGQKKVLRFNRFGRPDDAYNSAMANQPDIVSPVCMAVGPDDALFISDDKSNYIFVYDQRGVFLKLLPPGPAYTRAMAAYNDRIYVADGKTGNIMVFDCPSNAYIGTLPGYRGPVSAMAAGEDGTLFVKPGAGLDYYCFNADEAFVASGTLEAGPVDAGEQCQWERVYVKAEMPQGTEVILKTFHSNNPDAVPADGEWNVSPSLDMLLKPYPRSGSGQQVEARYLRLRVLLQGNSQESPRLLQVQAETAGKSYLDYLPAVYRRDDAPNGFLESWLALFRSQLQDLELTFEDIFRYFDPAVTPEEVLPWLAQWLAFDLPAGMRTGEKRSLIKKILDLYSRRGTIQGLKDFVQLYTGVRPLIFEAFRERHIWQLEHTSLLGCNTALAPALPDGMIVPGFTPTDPQYAGLQGDYYQGLYFDKFIFTRIDSLINFPSGSLPIDSRIEAGGFSVRWSGQVQPRYSENYTFSIDSAVGLVSLWIDGQLVINRRAFENLSGATQLDDSGKIALSAGRWYSIRLEYSCKNSLFGAISLSWSSRRQVKEVIPRSRLYALWDEWAELDPEAQDSAGGETLVVGRTVVGESGPLAASGFGSPLFCDTAHLFTVVIPSAQVPEASERKKIRGVIEAEKPAHTDYHLCFVEPRMRVGFQARVGIDSIVAGPPEPMDMSGSLLGLESYLGAEKNEGKFGRVGKRAHIGQDTVLG